jgi:hypothetical protein
MTELSPTLSPHPAPTGIQFGWFLIRDQSSRVCLINGTAGVSLLVPSPLKETVRPLELVSRTSRALGPSDRISSEPDRPGCETTNIKGRDARPLESTDEQA